MSRNKVLVLLFLVGIVVLVFYAIKPVNQVSCDVCITYKGQTECRTGVGADQEQAVRAATESACVILARGGMDDRINCSHTPPSKQSCK